MYIFLYVVDIVAFPGEEQEGYSNKGTVMEASYKEDGGYSSIIISSYRTILVFTNSNHYSRE